MKFVLLFVLAAVVAVSTSEVADPNSTSRTTRLSIGTITSNDRMLRNFLVTRPASISSTASTQTFSAPTGTRIFAVRAWEEGLSQGATVQQVGGGTGSTFVTLRFTNAPGRGFHITVQLWGR